MPTIRDQMYAEGIEFGDYVITEFLGKAASILDDSTKCKLAEKLRIEVSNHRKYCLETLENAQFIHPIVDNVPSTPPTPKDVSKSVLDALKAADPLPIHDFGRQSSATASALKRRPPPKELTISTQPTEENIPTTESLPDLRVVGNKVYNASMALYGVLDFNRTTPRRKYLTKKRRKSLGSFEKDGSFHAMTYGGFAHLCGGALEWPFKTAEINFSNFYQNTI